MVGGVKLREILSEESFGARALHPRAAYDRIARTASSPAAVGLTPECLARG